MFLFYGWNYFTFYLTLILKKQQQYLHEMLSLVTQHKIARASKRDFPCAVCQRNVTKQASKFYAALFFCEKNTHKSDFNAPFWDLRKRWFFYSVSVKLYSVVCWILLLVCCIWRWGKLTKMLLYFKSKWLSSIFITKAKQANS